MDLSSFKGTPGWVTVAEDLLPQETGDATGCIQKKKKNHRFSTPSGIKNILNMLVKYEIINIMNIIKEDTCYCLRTAFLRFSSSSPFFLNPVQHRM